MNIAEFEKLKSQIETKRTEMERKRGELSQVLKMLKSEFGCESVEEAETLLENLKEESAMLTERLEKKSEKLAEVWREFSND